MEEDKEKLNSPETVLHIHSPDKLSLSLFWLSFIMLVGYARHSTSG